MITKWKQEADVLKPSRLCQKNPEYVDKVVVNLGGGIYAQNATTPFISVATNGTVTFTGTEVITPGELTLAQNNILVGNASGVGADVAMSGDATIISTGVVTVTGATGAFNVGTNITLTKELAHSIAIADSTTANTVGGALTEAAGKGTGTAEGGALNLNSGASSNGTAVNPGASGAVNIASGAAGTATTGTAGAAGAVNIGGTAGGASTGASSTAGAGSDVTNTGGAGGASSGGGDTGGRGGNVINTAGAGGSGATAGRAGAIFNRGTFSRKYTVTAMTTSATVTTAALLGGMITANQGGAGAATYTLPTGTQLAAALPVAFTTGDSIDFTIINISTVDAEDVTVAGDTGTTMKGNVTVEANSAITKISSGMFRAVMTGANAFDVYRLT